MNKRIVLAICILVSVTAFMGGVAYGSNWYKPKLGIQVEENRILQSKYDAFFIMPIDSTTACVWFDPAYLDNKEYANADRYNNIAPITYSDKWIDKWVPINRIYLDLEEEYYKK